MKKLIIVFIVGLAVGVLVMVLLQPSPRGGLPAASKESNSFQSVISRLNRGGGLYFYLSTREAAASLEERIISLKEMFCAQPELTPNLKAELEAWFAFISRLLSHSGITGISGLGVSRISLANGLGHTRFFLHHYKQKDDGLIWNIFQRRPHRLEMLNLLPADTVFAAFTDFRLSHSWQWLKQHVGAAGPEPLQRVMVILDAMIKMQGVDLDQLLPSLNEELGIIITMDADKRIPVPGSGQIAVNIPEPAGAILLTVKDRQLFELLYQLLPTSPLSGSENKPDSFFIKIPGLPMNIQPVAALVADKLIVVSHQALLDRIRDAVAGRNRLKDSDHFKKLSLDMPVTGNAFHFLSPRLFNALMEAYTGTLKVQGDEGQARIAALEFFNPYHRDLTFFSILRRTGEGLLITCNHNVDDADIALMPAMVLAALLSLKSYP